MTPPTALRLMARVARCNRAYPRIIRAPMGSLVRRSRAPDVALGFRCTVLARLCVRALACRSRQWLGVVLAAGVWAARLSLPLTGTVGGSEASGERRTAPGRPVLVPPYVRRRHRLWLLSHVRRHRSGPPHTKPAPHAPGRRPLRAALLQRAPARRTGSTAGDAGGDPGHLRDRVDGGLDRRGAVRRPSSWHDGNIARCAVSDGHLSNRGREVASWSAIPHPRGTRHPRYRPPSSR